MKQISQKFLVKDKVKETKLKDRRKEWGRQGEEEAIVFLRKQGFQIEKKNWRVRSSLNSKKRIQVDLVVSKEKHFYIVEVKKHIWTYSGFESLISDSQRGRLISLTYSLQRLKYQGQSWGFLLVWIHNTEAKIIERLEYQSFR